MIAIYQVLQSAVAVLALAFGLARLAGFAPVFLGGLLRLPRRWGVAEILGGIFLLTAFWVPVFLIPGVLAVLITVCVGLARSLKSRRFGPAGAIIAAAGLIGWLAVDRGPWALDYFTRFSPKPAGAYQPLPSRTIARFPDDAPVLLESITPLTDGSFLVSAGSKGQIWRVERTGRRSVLVQLPHGGFGTKRFQGVVGGITLGPDRQLYVSLVAIDPRHRGVWVINPKTGASRQLARLPRTAQPNGITFGPDGALYIADSELATIWRISPKSGEVVKWVEADELGRAISWLVPGANGIKVFNGSVFVSNSFTGKIYRIAIGDDGRAGTLVEIASELSGDDFSLDVQGNLYITTHPFNSVIRISPDGKRTIIADERQGVIGPTDAKYGVTASDRSTLYVINDGGFVVSHPDGVPSITAIDTGVEGHMVP